MATRLKTANRNRLSARDVLNAQFGDHTDGGGAMSKYMLRRDESHPMPQGHQRDE